MIAMIPHPQSVFDHRGNPLCGPQLRTVTVRHSPSAQEANKSLLLFGCQPGWSARRRLGLQPIRPAGSQRIPPPKDTAGVTTHSAGDLMKRQFLLKQNPNLSTTIFQ